MLTEFAFWQALHPQSTWLKDSADVKEKLLSFRRNKTGDFHTSQTIEDTIARSYSYPVFEPWHHDYQANGKFDYRKFESNLKKRSNIDYASTRRAEQKAVMSITRQQAPDLSIESLATAAPFTAPDIWSEITN